MDVVTKDILQTLKGQTSALSGGNVAPPLASTSGFTPAGSRARKTSAISAAGTINHITAPAALAIVVRGLWISCRNDHATDVTTITIQDTAGSPVILLTVYVGPSSQVNGFVDLNDIPAPLTAAKGLDIVVASGTPTGRVTSWTTQE